MIAHIIATLILTITPPPVTTPVNSWGWIDLTPKPTIVYIDNHIWPSNVHHAAAFIDKYTYNRFVFGKCHAGYKCIRLTFGIVKGSSTGYTLCRNRICTLTLERSLSARYRTRVIEHEFGHANGLSHTRGCKDIMYPYRVCRSGNQPPEYVTPSERAILATE